MRRYFSLLTLAVLVFLAVAGTSFFESPDDAKAPPWSKPIWLSRRLAPPVELPLSGDRESVAFQWDWDSPLRMTLTGTLRSGEVVLERPQGPNPQGSQKGLGSQEGPGSREIFVLARADMDQPLDLDARDIPFKQSLGFSPFENVSRRLFASQGTYFLRLTGAGDVVLNLEGGRRGWLGTDQRGRDIAALFVGGIRISLIVGLSATFIATLLGLSLGLVSGYAGGLTDAFLMRVVDVLLSIPTLPILMVLAGIWGHSLWNLVLVLSLFSWMGTARTVRALTLSLRDAAWVEGLRALGARRGYILFRHLAPEVLPLLLATVALGVPGAILAEAGVAFLGLSDPLLPSWGRMLHEAHVFGAFTHGAWWMILPPGLGIAAICLIFMDIGRKLEERVDPRLVHAREASS